MKKLSILMVVAFALVTPSAVADRRVVTDPSESHNEGFAFDFERAVHAHKKVGSRSVLVHKITTFSPWETGDLRSNRMRLRFDFDRDHNVHWDRVLVIRLNPDGSIRAEMYAPPARLRGYANVYRPDDHSLKVEFPRKLLGKRPSKYWWSWEVEGEGWPEQSLWYDETDWTKHRLH